MIVNGGLLQFLTAKVATLTNTTLRLFVTDVTIEATTIISDLTEASWTGYGGANTHTWSTPVIGGSQAISNDTDSPTFTNSSGTTQTYYGWFLKNDDNGLLISAFNTGPQTIIAGATVTFTPSITDANTGP